MNRRMIAYITGKMLLVEAGLLLLPAITAIVYGEWKDLYTFLLTSFILAVLGFGCTMIKVRTKTIYSREGLLAVAFGWITLSLGGMLPFLISGAIPSFIDALFETVSGFTTTGASILSDVESLSKSMLFWRSFTHWVGGMGVLVFVMAALPLASGGGNIHLMRAESPGPDVSKLVPSSRGTAVRLYAIYIVMTVLEVIILLCLGNPLFDSLTLSFGTAGTGGFAIKNSSLADYSVATQITITVFMTAFGVNFSCYYLLLSRKFKELLKNEELRAYLIILATAIAIITINTQHMYESTGQALNAAAFQASSVMTTTGYATVDFNLWPELSRIVMLALMCIGACVGSTGGGIKVARILILFKESVRQIRRSITPNRIDTVRLNGKPVSESIVTGIVAFFTMHVLLFAISLFLVSFDKMDIVSNITAVIATLNNIGPGLNVVGATGNFGGFSAFSKLVLIFDMLAGRLELLPVFAIFSVRTWRD